MAGKPRLYLDEKYRQLKKTLSKEDKEKIKKIEKLCLDTKLNYFDVSREVETMIWGPFPRHFTLEDIHQLKTPLSELADYLMRRAGHIRGIKFSDEYTTVLGETVVIKELPPEQKELLRRALTQFKNKEEWGKFCNKTVYSDETVKLLGGELFNGRYYITEKVHNKPLFQVLTDLEVRLGLEQGKMSQGPCTTHLDFTENEKMLEEFLNRQS